MTRREGYTLVELVVVIFIFSVVMTMISSSFSKIVASSGQIVKSGETDIGGLIGLEVLRCDLEFAGFGLFWSYPPGVTFTYLETGQGGMVDGCPDGCPGADASTFNDSYPNAPRAYVLGNNVGFNGSDYLVLKGTALGMTTTCRKWGYLGYSSVGAAIKPSKSEVELATGNNDRVVVIKTGVTAGGQTRELVTAGAQSSSFSLLFNTPLPDGFLPKDRQDAYLVYGVDPADASGADLTVPYNRADYYISSGGNNLSSICAPHTGVLFKTAFNQNSSQSTKYPLLDCVADLQVVLYMDTNKDGEVDYHPQSMDSFSADDLREQLKEIRVYILAQQGKMDPGYLFPLDDPNKAIIVGDAGLDPSLGQWWSDAQLSDRFGPQWRHYRWKVYTIVVQPKNL